MCKTVIITGAISATDPGKSVLRFKRGDTVKTILGVDANMLFKSVEYWASHGLPKDMVYGWATVTGGHTDHLFFGDELESACGKIRSKYQHVGTGHGRRCARCSKVLADLLTAEVDD